MARSATLACIWSGIVMVIPWRFFCSLSSISESRGNAWPSDIVLPSCSIGSRPRRTEHRCSARLTLRTSLPPCIPPTPTQPTFIFSPGAGWPLRARTCRGTMEKAANAAVVPKKSRRVNCLLFFRCFFHCSRPFYELPSGFHNGLRTNRQSSKLPLQIGHRLPLQPLPNIIRHGGTNLSVRPKVL